MDEEYSATERSLDENKSAQRVLSIQRSIQNDLIIKLKKLHPQPVVLQCLTRRVINVNSVI